MHITRLVAGAVTAGLLSLTPIAVTAPASATENLTTTITLEQNYGEPKIVHGDEISLVGEVRASDGGSVYSTTDTITLWAMPAGTTTWTAVTTVDGGGYFSIPNFTPAMNTAYKATYSGSTAATVYDDTYAASESAPLNIGVARKITSPQRGFVLKGTVSPDGARKKIYIKVSKSQKRGYRKFRTITTDSRGTYRTTLPRRGGTWYYIVMVKGDSQYLPTGYGWRTWVG